jgi:phage FluMu gp28-like protein
MTLDPFQLLCPYQLAWLRDAAPLAIGEKSRRIGWTWTQALGVVLDRAAGKGNYYHSSADMTASIEFIADCRMWAEMVNAVATISDGVEVIDDASISTLVMTFANGTKIVAGSSNPKFFRSKGGAAGLDEFAFHRDGRELYKAAHATAMFWGHKLRIWSTHNGPASYFNSLIRDAKEINPSTGRPRLKASLHRVTILDAVEQGIVERIDMRAKKLDHVPAPDARRRQEWLDELRSTCPDEDTWNEEYMCVPSTDASSLLSYDLIGGCEVANLVKWDEPRPEAQWPSGNRLYAGFDVARRRDLSFVWVVEQIGDVFWTRYWRGLLNVPFSAQEGLLNTLMAGNAIRRLCIDSTGLGMQMAERMQQKWGKYRVEGVSFTAPVKSELAMPLRRLFEDKLIRIPKDDVVREDLHSIRKSVTTAGNVRLDADRGETDGHADRFWALALAYHATEGVKRYRPPLRHKPIGF